jgi:hypothetical protein
MIRIAPPNGGKAAHGYRRWIAGCLAGLAALTAWAACAANDGCREEGPVLVCAVKIGQTAVYEFSDSMPAKSLKLVNDSAGDVQIYRVWTEPVATNRWGEYCLSIGVWRTGQTRPGWGDAACTHKEEFEPAFAPLQWNSAGTAPTLPPGAAAYVGGYVLSPSRTQDHRKTVHVTARHGVGNVYSYRQPREDVPIRCNGQFQTTDQAPWTNTSGRDLTISGAIIYAVDARKRDSVDDACITVLDITGTQARWRFCTGVNVRGSVSFPPVRVAPGEAIAAQGSNTCAAPALWDWAAYIHVSE